MPISSTPGISNRTTGAAGEFKETTAAFRKTGPVEKYQPLSDNIKKLTLDGLGPTAPRVEELQADGKNISVADIRAAEVAAKLQKGENLSPSEIAQALVSIRAALDTGLSNHDSPYYQATTALRSQRERELQLLHDELNGYLTGTSRTPHDEPIMERRFAWRPWRITQGINRIPGWVSSTLHSGIEIRRPGHVDHNTGRTRRVTPEANSPLTPAMITEGRRQSRVLEAYNNARERIAQQRRGVSFSGIVDGRERRMIIYEASDEVATQFYDEEVRNILGEAKGVAKEGLLDTALRDGSSAEKSLARKYQRLGVEDNVAMVRKSKELARIRTMEEFQRFLGVDELMLSKSEIAEAIAAHLGIRDPREINRLKRGNAGPNEAFSRLYNSNGELGTIIFAGELFKDKLEKFAHDRENKEEGKIEPPERKRGEPYTELTKDAIIGMDPGAIALMRAEGKLPRDAEGYLKGLGISEPDAKKIVEDSNKFMRGTAINEDTQINMSSEDLAIRVQRRGLDLNDPADAALLHGELVESAKKQGLKVAERTTQADVKINEIRELLKITNGSLPADEQKEAIKKWDKRSLGLLTLFLGTVFATRITGLMSENETRGFQNLFA